MSLTIGYSSEGMTDTSILPANVFSLRDEPFFDFIREEAGDDAAATIFEVQGMNGVKSLSMTPVVFIFIAMKCSTLEDMKKQIAFRQDDDSYVVKAGIRSCQAPSVSSHMSSSALSLNRWPQHVSSFKMCQRRRTSRSNAQQMSTECFGLIQL